MTVNFDTDIELNLDFDYKQAFQDTINACLDYVDCPYETEVNLLITDNDTIHELNKENRGIDRATDVLSFPMIDYAEPADFNFTEEEEIALCNPETGELLLGDIVISMDTAVAQAEEYGHSLKRELCFLVAHSMLHLFGYDHMEDEERLRMEDMQKEILNSIGITR